jgi:hypothetical protein
MAENQVDISVIKGIVSSAIADAMAANAAAQASAGTASARTVSNAEQDAKDYAKTSFTDQQVDSDIGAEEAHTAAVHDQTRSWNANTKATYDAHQTLDKDALHQWREQVEAWRQLKLQAAQNAVETANMISKQAVKHADFAQDRMWNIDEVSGLSAKTPVQLDALATVLAGAIADAMKSK